MAGEWCITGGVSSSMEDERSDVPPEGKRCGIEAG
jgi:hypothetical protein